MIDEKDIQMSDAPIDMPPLNEQPPILQAGAQEYTQDEMNYGLPPEIQAAQQYEREQAKLRAQEQEETHNVAFGKTRAPQREPEPEQEDTLISSAKDKESNLRILREASERAMRERDALARKLQEYEDAKQQKVESPDEDFDFKEEDLLEGKHLKQAIKRIKQLEQQQKQYMQQNSAVSAEIKLRQRYPDFDKVMTEENVQMLAASYPELASSINSTSDLFDKAASAYTIIKKFGIYNEAPHEAAKIKAVANSSKPRPASSINAQKGDSPISRANMFADGLTEDLKEKLRKEMDECAMMY